MGRSRAKTSRSYKLFSSMAPSLPDRLGAGERGRDVARVRLRLRRSRIRAATAVRTILALHTTISRPLGRLLFAVFYFSSSSVDDRSAG